MECAVASILIVNCLNERYDHRSYEAIGNISLEKNQFSTGSEPMRFALPLRCSTI